MKPDGLSVGARRIEYSVIIAFANGGRRSTNGNGDRGELGAPRPQIQRMTASNLLAPEVLFVLQILYLPAERKDRLSTFGDWRRHKAAQQLGEVVFTHMHVSLAHHYLPASFR